MTKGLKLKPLCKYFECRSFVGIKICMIEYQLFNKVNGNHQMCQSYDNNMISKG